MVGAFRAEVVYAPRSAPGDALAGGFLTVEKAQDIAVKACLAVGAKLAHMAREILPQHLQISRAALGTADAIDEQEQFF